MIAPTVGRVVWYWPATPQHDASQPMAAMVAYVWGPRMVNLSVVGHNGEQFPVTSVMLRQPDDPKPEGCAYCEWMPYQKGQAARTDAAESALAARA